MEKKIQTYCGNASCGKTQCARHRSRHDRVTAADLNPNMAARCPYYLSRFQVGKEIAPSVGETYGQKGGVMSWPGRTR